MTDKIQAVIDEMVSRSLAAIEDGGAGIGSQLLDDWAARLQAEVLANQNFKPVKKTGPWVQVGTFAIRSDGAEITVSRWNGKQEDLDNYTRCLTSFLNAATGQLPDTNLGYGLVVPGWIVANMLNISAWFKTNTTNEFWSVAGIGPLHKSPEAKLEETQVVHVGFTLIDQDETRYFYRLEEEQLVKRINNENPRLRLFTTVLGGEIFPEVEEPS